VRRNLVVSWVVLPPYHVIPPGVLPRPVRAGGAPRLLPVHVGPIVRGQEGAAGHELEFILRSLLELKLQVVELRRQVHREPGVAVPPPDAAWIGEGRVTSATLPVTGATVVDAAATTGGGPAMPIASAIEPRDQKPPPNVLTVTPGMKMADIERAAIELALKETRGNRRRAADLLGIGERTLYRKIKEYRMPEHEYALD
jgi:hypothetical protein